MIGIYVIKNKKGVPVYVGQSKGIFRRWATHELNDYPSTKYTYEILETCERHELISKEKKWITQLDTYHNGDNKTGKRKRKRIKRQSMNIDGKDKFEKYQNYLEDINRYDFFYKNKFLKEKIIFG